jgi:hypothetical protein
MKATVCNKTFSFQTSIKKMEILEYRQKFSIESTVRTKNTIWCLVKQF